MAKNLYNLCCAAQIDVNQKIPGKGRFNNALEQKQVLSYFKMILPLYFYGWFQYVSINPHQSNIIFTCLARSQMIFETFLKCCCNMLESPDL